MSIRHLNFTDKLIGDLQNALQVLVGPTAATRPYPPDQVEQVAETEVLASEPALSKEDQALSGALMRVNHVGEVCAQALYRGQARTARDPAIREQFEKAAVEESDHLAWTAQRLSELRARPSLLNPVWYAGSYALGVMAGYRNDAVSLGFMQETERQVEAHLDGHLQRLPADDHRSRQIVAQMKQDEADHATQAARLGAQPLPTPAREAMRSVARLMTSTAYRL